ncbi:hypothetical protein [Occallatibacter savannae]|uniref:hypothetical protein n=1 Tax=Occallatibacter savannae TaxID=1002691 RepID=UPI000D69A172|nr:hypothetical protein [Occallatibacter savannae]
MRSIFRKVILASAAGVAVALAGNCAMAATRINVPFNFSVAGKMLPAGSYHLVHESSSGFVTLSSLDSNQSYTWLLTPGPSEYDRKIALKFDDRNGTHVLQSVQYGSKITPRIDQQRSIDMERESGGQ